MFQLFSIKHLKFRAKNIFQIRWNCIFVITIAQHFVNYKNAPIPIFQLFEISRQKYFFFKFDEITIFVINNSHKHNLNNHNEVQSNLNVSKVRFPTTTIKYVVGPLRASLLAVKK